ncbi:hypothetical protein D3C71_2157780 [compost metagenome]
MLLDLAVLLDLPMEGDMGQIDEVVEIRDIKLSYLKRLCFHTNRGDHLLQLEQAGMRHAVR